MARRFKPLGAVRAFRVSGRPGLAVRQLHTTVRRNRTMPKCLAAVTDSAASLVI